MLNLIDNPFICALRSDLSNARISNASTVMKDNFLIRRFFKDPAIWISQFTI